MSNSITFLSLLWHHDVQLAFKNLLYIALLYSEKKSAYAAMKSTTLCIDTNSHRNTPHTDSVPLKVSVFLVAEYFKASLYEKLCIWYV